MKLKELTTDNILLQAKQDKGEEETKSGIIIPDSVEKTPENYYKVEMAGPEAQDLEGETVLIYPNVVQRWQARDKPSVEVDGVEYILAQKKNVAGVAE